MSRMEIRGSAHERKTLREQNRYRQAPQPGRQQKALEQTGQFYTRQERTKRPRTGDRYGVFRIAGRLHAQEVFEQLHRRVAVDRGDRRRKRNALRTGPHAVLRVAAAFDAAVVHQRFQTLGFVHLARRMGVEQANLGNRRRSDEAGTVVDVRASLEADAASHALGQLVSPLALRLGHPWSRTEIVGAVDRNPCLDALEGIEHALAVDDEVAHDRERAHRSDAYRLLQLVDQGAARLARLAVDDHGAGSAYFLEAVRLPAYRSRGRAVGFYRVALDFHQGADDVHVRAVRNLKLFGIRSRIRRILTGNNELDHFTGLGSCFGCHCRSPSSLVLVARVVALARRNERSVDFLVRNFRAFRREFRDGRLQELLVVPFRELRLVVRAAALVAEQRALGHRLGQLQHVPQLAGEGDAGVVPAGRIVDVDVGVALLELLDLLDRLLQTVVVADDGHVVRHPLAELLGQHVGVLRAVHLEDGLVLVRAQLHFAVEDAGRHVFRGLFKSFDIFHSLRSRHHPAENGGQQGVRAETVRSMVLVLAFAAGEQARDVGHLVVVDPHAAHRIVDRREDLHRQLARIVADELLVDLDDAAELDVELLGILMGKIEVDHILAVDAELLVDAYGEDLAGRDVARHEVAVSRVFLLEEVPRLAVLVRPDAAAFAARRFGHETVFVVARNGRRVDLDHLAVGVVDALLVHRAGCRARIDDRVGRLAENDAGAACRQDDRVGAEGMDLHRAQVLAGDAAADAVLVHDRSHELEMLMLADEAGGLPAAYLLVQRVQQLLARRRAGERRAVVLRAAEAAEVQQAFRRAAEHDAHPVHQVDDAGGRFAHRLDRRLVGEEVASVDGIVEVLPWGVPFALCIDGAVDAALRAHGVGALDRHEREQVDVHARLGRLDCSHQAGESAADDDNVVFSHDFEVLLVYRINRSRYVRRMPIRRSRCP
ncbi:hypothetical protein BN871_AL_00170 [Paenibacillus sp. P22]|nr:hypothetical protein BN871_AL_00170 [Paenibacillus sp. P22]